MAYTNPWSGNLQSDSWYSEQSPEDQRKINDKNRSNTIDQQYNDWIAGIKPGSQPDYQGAVDKNGNLLDEYTLKGQASIMPELESQLSGINYDRTALDELQNRALSTGPSAWANLAKGANQQNTANLLDQASAQGNANQASAYSQLASRGGLRQGAMQNIAARNSKDTMLSKMGVRNQGGVNDTNIALQDQASKDSMLSNLPSQQAAALQPALQKAGLWTNAAQNNQQYQTAIDSQNLNTKLQNLGQQNAWNLQNYQTNMGAVGNYQQSQAIKDSKGGFLGSWICTEVNKLEALDTRTMAELKKLRKSALKHAKIRTRFYLNGFGGLLDLLKKQNYDFSQLRDFVVAVAHCHRACPETAVEMYWNKCVELCRELGV